MRPKLGILALGAVVLAWSVAPLAVGASDDPISLGSGPVVIEVIDPDQTDTEASALQDRVTEIEAALDAAPVPVPLGLPGRSGAATAGFVAAFDANVPNDVRTIVQASIGEWSTALDTRIPVVVQVSWTCFNDVGVLGFAGSTEIYRLPSLPTGYAYPAALANTLVGSDLNGATPELRVVLNAELAATNSCAFAADRWHVSTSAPPPGRIDLASVVLHEIAHGLGFLGSAWRNQGASAPALDAVPYVYDSFVQTADGPLLGRPNPNAYLTSPLSIDVGGGRSIALYSPSGFQNGSSFSHFSPTATSAVGGALMNPDLGSGIANRTLDAAVLGVLDQQGWTIARPAVTPAIGLSVSSGRVSVTIDPRLDQAGAAPVSYRVVATRGGTVDADLTVPASRDSVTLTPLYNGVSYQISVTPVGRTGVGTAATGTVTMPAMPNQPRLVTVGGASLQPTISWQAPVASAGAVSYRLEQRAIGGAWVVVGDTSATSLTTGPLAAGVYQFRVSAANGSGRGPTALSLVTGLGAGLVRPLPLDGEVGRLYTAYFLRDPDASGFQYWLEQRARGLGLNAISSEFARSGEFVNRYGSLSNDAFVELVYRNVLGRAPDAAGLRYWSSQLRNGRSRGDVMVGFSESPEFVTASRTARSTTPVEGRITRLYFAFFLREPDPAGLSFWSGLASSGTSLEVIAQEMARSEEFQNTYGSLPNARFVELVYNNVLTRDPDAGGNSYWLGRLDAGVSRGSMMVGFSESLEFVLRTGTIR